ncbi:MAG: ABC transporter permease [Anaerolineae bacterium]|nr:ABC transporter permease [Anaerolineae bacterium]
MLMPHPSTQKDARVPAKLHAGIHYTGRVILALGLSVLGGSCLVLLAGENPLEVYGRLLSASFASTHGLMITIQRATPLIFTALAATLAFQGGAINMGLAGQFTAGASIAGLAASALPPLPKVLHLTAILSLCMLGGATAAFIPAFFKWASGVHEVITGMIANLLIPHLLSLLRGALGALGWLHRMAEAQGLPGATELPPSAQLLQFQELTGGAIGEGTRANTGIFLALALMVVLTLWLKRSRLGYEIRITRANATFAQFSGIHAGRMFFISMMLSGAIAGAGGAVEALGVWRSGSTGGLAVSDRGLVLALIGGQTFWGATLAALFYGGLESGAMHASWFTAISRPLLDILVELLVLFAALPGMRAFFGDGAQDPERLGSRFVGRGTWK